MTPFYNINQNSMRSMPSDDLAGKAMGGGVESNDAPENTVWVFARGSGAYSGNRPIIRVPANENGRPMHPFEKRSFAAPGEIDPASDEMAGVMQANRAEMEKIIGPDAAIVKLGAQEQSN